MGIALHLIWPSFDADLLRTGGLRALGLTLAPSADVSILPDMTAWSSIFQGTVRLTDLTKIVTLCVSELHKQNGRLPTKMEGFRVLPPIQTKMQWSFAGSASDP